MRPEELAFDHAAILHVGMARIQSKLRYSWVAFQLLPEPLRRRYALLGVPQH